jgi:hypothetical protein
VKENNGSGSEKRLLSLIEAAQESAREQNVK